MINRSHVFRDDQKIEESGKGSFRRRAQHTNLNSTACRPSHTHTHTQRLISLWRRHSDMPVPDGEIKTPHLSCRFQQQVCSTSCPADVNFSRKSKLKPRSEPQAGTVKGRRNGFKEARPSFCTLCRGALHANRLCPFGLLPLRLLGSSSFASASSGCGSDRSEQHGNRT